uniref:Uncharacterized protein n=1 Tax=Siphoviridae sp. ctBLh2 TaxID=2827803 RepID=A0A8S5S3D8_9CAUD|nr:MAG TPA: hypothetical protein [Siphoviridae sp. ctBLh2]
MCSPVPFSVQAVRFQAVACLFCVVHTEFFPIFVVWQ